MTRQTKEVRGRIFAEEALLTQVQVAMHRSLEALGWTRRALAKRLGVSESQVSQYFGAEANLTVKTVARIFFAMGDKCLVSSERLAASDGWGPRQLVSPTDRHAEIEKRPLQGRHLSVGKVGLHPPH